MDAELQQVPNAGSFIARAAAMELHAAERRLVEYLLSIPEYELATATSAQLAERAQTSRSTLDRLARKFGFAGHKQLRKALLQDSRAMKAQVGSGPTLEPTITKADRPADIAFKVFNSASVRALKFAELLAGSSALDELVEAVLKARTIQIFGAGASAVVGLDMHQRLLRLGLAINFAEDAHTQIALAALMRRGDLAICISYSGQTKSTVRAAEVARGQGAFVAGVLGAAESPLAALTHIKVLSPPGVGLFGSDAVMTRILQVMFNEALFHCLAIRRDDLLENVHRIDAVLNEEKVDPGYRSPLGDAAPKPAKARRRTSDDN
jgi:DNA-binding MurR/RpiR family transcriptional regulator